MKQEDVRQYIFKLFINNEHMARYEDAIVNLFDLCTSDRERFLISHFMNNLMIVRSQGYQRALDHLVSSVKSKIDHDKPHALVAMAYDDQPDSSQGVIHRLKTKFINYKNVVFFSSVPAYLRNNNIVNCPNFTIVDDFSGTGQTIINRMKHIFDNAKGRSVIAEGSAAILFGMEKAYLNAIGAGIDVIFSVKLKAGVSDFFSGAEAQEMTACALRLEEELAQEYDGRTLPSFGYGQAEALFGIEDQNAPNSNFPVLWWPRDAELQRRTTMFERFEG